MPWTKCSSIGTLALCAALTACGKPIDHDSSSNPQYDQPWNDSGEGPVTAVYGLAKIRAGSFQAESKVKPWSAYWFPPGDPVLYDAGRAGPAPLGKYDNWCSTAKKIQSHAADYERQKDQAGSFGDGYAGLTSAWARAAVLEPEPTKAATLNGVRFEVFDLKALLIESYEQADGFTDYGSSYTGAPGQDVQQIYADQFHRFLQAQLFEKGKPFIMSRDPGPQVWEVPVYKASLDVRADAGNAYVMHVHATVQTAGTRDDSGYVGTWPVTYEYYYDLFGSPLGDGSFLVKSGVWTGPSVENHPGFVTSVPDRSAHRSLNPEIRTDFVNEIEAASRR